MSYKAVITTSANPFHYGHLYIYEMAEKIFGKNNVLCLIAKNHNKDSDLNRIQYHIAPYNINYEIIQDITVADYCKNNNINFIIRGIRNGVDAEYELKLDFINKKINQEIQTIYIPTTDTFSNISSSVIRQLISMKKFDIIHEFMNIDACRRYIQEKPKYIAFYGMSCIGKSTYLKKHQYNAVNIDQFMWKVVQQTEGKENTEIRKKQLRQLLNNGNVVAFKQYLKDALTNNKKFWNKFFLMLQMNSLDEYIYLDFDAIGNYWHYIDSYYKSQIKLIRIETTKIKRAENVISRANERNITVNEMSEKINILDKIYEQPPYFDEIIRI